MATERTHVPARRFGNGDVVYRQGEPGDCMYVVRSGKVAVSQRQGRAERQLAELGPGDYFGEMALFDGETRIATVRAVGEETWIDAVDRDALLRKIHEDPALAFRLIEQLCQRVRDLERRLVRQSWLSM